MFQSREGVSDAFNLPLEVGRPEWWYQHGREPGNEDITDAPFEPNYCAQEIRGNLPKN